MKDHKPGQHQNELLKTQKLEALRARLAAATPATKKPEVLAAPINWRRSAMALFMVLIFVLAIVAGVVAG